MWSKFPLRPAEALVGGGRHSQSAQLQCMPSFVPITEDPVSTLPSGQINKCVYMYVIYAYICRCMNTYLYSYACGVLQ